jgi:hypothetical protein
MKDDLIEMKDDLIEMKDDLPNGAIKHEENAVRQMLDVLRKNEIDLYDKTHFCLNGGVKHLRGLGAIESGDGWYKDNGNPDRQSRHFFNGELHPTIDGVNYFRGIAVPTVSGAILLYTPWITSNARADTYQVYKMGAVPDVVIFKVMSTYCEGMDEKIKADFEEHAKESESSKDDGIVHVPGGER